MVTYGRNGEVCDAAVLLQSHTSQGFMDFSKRGVPPTYQETVPITYVLTARIHLWKNSRMHTFLLQVRHFML